MAIASDPRPRRPRRPGHGSERFRPPVPARPRRKWPPPEQRGRRTMAIELGRGARARIGRQLPALIRPSSAKLSLRGLPRPETRGRSARLALPGPASRQLTGTNPAAPWERPRPPRSAAGAGGGARGAGGCPRLSAWPSRGRRGPRWRGCVVRRLPQRSSEVLQLGHAGTSLRLLHLV